MQRSGVVGNVARASRYSALAVALLATDALAGTAAPSQGSSAASRAATVGVSYGGVPSQGVFVAIGGIYGGVTSQDFPVVVDVNRRRSRVVRAVIAIRTSCTSGGFVTVPDGYRNVSVRRGKFSASFGPTTQRNDDGTTSDLEGTMSGTFNSSRTKVSGKWTFKATDHDAAGAVTDTCDSGSVSWSAKQ